MPLAKALNGRLNKWLGSQCGWSSRVMGRVELEEAGEIKGGGRS